MKRKWLLAGIVVLIVMLIGFGVFKRSKGAPTEEVRRGPIHEAIFGLGTVKSAKIFEHKQGVTSQITRIFVREGQVVKAGDPLIQLEGTPIVRAPFNGTVTSLPFHENENIFPQVSLVRLEDLKALFIEVNLEQQGALRVRPQLKARMSFESLRGQTYSGLVESLYPLNGQFIVRIIPDNLPPEILPGMTVDVAIEVQTKENVLLVPAAALNNGQITAVRDGKRQRIPVEIGLMDGEWAEVVSGEIKDTDLVVLPRK